MSVIVVSFYLHSIVTFVTINIGTETSTTQDQIQFYLHILFHHHKNKKIVIEGYIILQATNNKNTHYCKVEKLYNINKISITCI